MHEDDGMMGQFIVYDNATSVSELIHFSDRIEVYPNPVIGDQITVSILPEFAMRAKRIKLTDAGGKVVKNVTAISTNYFKIDVKDIAPGVYFLSVDFGNATAVHRVVKN